MDNVYETARKYALKNAKDYGKADVKAVFGKLVGSCPEAKRDVKSAMETTRRAVDEANAMGPSQLEAELSKFEFDKPKKQDDDSKALVLPNAEKGKVVTRIPPEPNGYPHIGHAKAGFLNMDCAAAYDGKFVIRWDDTNPEAEKAEFVDAIRDGFSWLGITAAAETFVSDDIPKLYGYARQLCEQGDAYVCMCNQERVKELRSLGKGCDCRGNPAEANLDLWDGMLNGRFRRNQAVLRLKADMASANTVMRDPVLFRIIETPHYRQADRYRVWPTYDFDVCIEDSITGITHPMRSKEYELRDELYYFILEKLGLRKPTMIEFSRLAIKGMPISKRLLKKLIAEEKVSGWDDPRLPTLMGLRRRGILPQAIANFVRSFGLSKVESEPPIDRLLVENKRLLEPAAGHYFFVANPVRVHVKGAPTRVASLRKHPLDEAAGMRKFPVNENYYIASADASALSVGETFRLKDLLNAKVTASGTNFVETEYVSDEGTVAKKLQWVPNDSSAVPAKLLAPSELLDADEAYRPDSLLTLDGYCEPECRKLRKGDVVQFERVGFAVLDDEKGMRFVMATQYRP